MRRKSARGGGAAIRKDEVRRGFSGWVAQVPGRFSLVGAAISPACLGAKGVQRLTPMPSPH